MRDADDFSHEVHEDDLYDSLVLRGRSKEPKVNVGLAMFLYEVGEHGPAVIHLRKCPPRNVHEAPSLVVPHVRLDDSDIKAMQQRLEPERMKLFTAAKSILQSELGLLGALGDRVTELTTIPMMDTNVSELWVVYAMEISGVKRRESDVMVSFTRAQWETMGDYRPVNRVFTTIIDTALRLLTTARAERADRNRISFCWDHAVAAYSYLDPVQQAVLLQRFANDMLQTAVDDIVEKCPPAEYATMRDDVLARTRGFLEAAALYQEERKQTKRK